jgi:hypothetical protein
MLPQPSRRNGFLHGLLLAALCVGCVLALLAVFISLPPALPSTSVRAPAPVFKAIQNLDCLDLSIMWAALHVASVVFAGLPLNLASSHAPADFAFRGLPADRFRPILC